MTDRLRSELLIESGDWKIRKLFKGGDFSHYVLEYRLDQGHSSNPFDEVRASGGLLLLNYNGERSTTFTGVINGQNRYEKGDMPQEIFEELREIGPY